MARPATSPPPPGTPATPPHAIGPTSHARVPPVSPPSTSPMPSSPVPSLSPSATSPHSPPSPSPSPTTTSIPPSPPASTPTVDSPTSTSRRISSLGRFSGRSRTSPGFASSTCLTTACPTGSLQCSPARFASLEFFSVLSNLMNATVPGFLSNVTSLRHLQLDRFTLSLLLLFFTLSLLPFSLSTVVSTHHILSHFPLPSQPPTTTTASPSSPATTSLPFLSVPLHHAGSFLNITERSLLDHRLRRDAVRVEALTALASRNCFSSSSTQLPPIIHLNDFLILFCAT